MYKITDWQDHVTEYENRYTESQNDDGTVTHVPVEGEIIQQGTPMSAANFNNMEQGIHAANVAAIMAMNTARLALEAADSNTVIKTVILSNGLRYPFNNSKETVALESNEERHNTKYIVLAEVVAACMDEGPTINNAGLAGNIIVSDKMTNGFKMEYTGSASEVEFRLYIVGGM